MILSITIQASKKVFSVLNSDLTIDRSMTYGELENRVAVLSQKITYSANPVLLLFEDAEEFIVAFLACQKKGMIPVPMFFPKSKRNFDRLSTVISNSKCDLVLCETKNQQRIQTGIHKIIDSTIKIVSSIDLEQLPDNNLPDLQNEVAFIQYTSGSTALPKGVIVSFENLEKNQQMIQELFGCNEQSIILSWLPFYHDMGLIGNLLHTLYVGATCYLMSPLSVVQSPFSWLKAISTYHVTHSGGPNFMYDLCVQKTDRTLINELDLSSWKVAYNGSEPIKRSTIESFIDTFSNCGFNAEAYYTCYGLAEATLLVSGGKYVDSNTEFLSSGQICAGADVQILNDPSKSSEGGEILIHGDSVTKGYLNQSMDELFVELNGKQYLKTGDIGTIINQELIISGRSKELIIINGKNYFPYDLENEIAASMVEVEENGVIVSYIVKNGMETPIVFAELKKAALLTVNTATLCSAIDHLMIELCGVECADIILFNPRKLERTSSGKLQRVATKNNYLAQELEAIYSKRTILIPTSASKQQWIKAILNEGDLDRTRDYLSEILSDKLKISLCTTDFDRNLLDLGVDSLRSVEIVSVINADLGLNIHVNKLLNLQTTLDFEEFIKNLVWMKSTTSNDESILI